MADGKVKIDVVVRSISELNKVQKQLGNNIGKVKLLSTGIGSLGNQLGFVAFQFTFMAGIAQRALQSIQQNFQRVIEDAAAAEDQVIRAIAQSGLEIGARRDAVAIQFLNDSIRDLGSGKTLFATKEVAEASKEVGRAFTFTGTEMEKAQSVALVTRNVLRLMTIEQIGAEKASIQMAKVMKQFGLSASDAADLVGILVEVNQSSSATLDQLTASISAAGNMAQEFGVTLKETAVIAGVLADRIGVKNSAAGRGFRRILENLARTTQSLNPQLEGFGIIIRDSSGKLNNIVTILKQFRIAMDKGGEAGDIARQVILELGTTSILSKDALLALVKGVEDIESGLLRLEDATIVGEQFEKIFSETTEGKIKRIKGAINSLKIDFVSGLSPALTIIIQEFNEIVRTKEIQEFFKLLGKTLAEDFVPVLNQLAKIFRVFVRLLKNSSFVVSILSKAFLVLLGTLTTLFIVGTIGALFASMAAGLQRLIGFLGLTTASTILLVRAFLPLLAAGIGVFIALKAVDNIIGILKDGFQDGEAGALALNAALLVLGGGITALGLRFSAAGIGVALSGFAPGLVAALGSTAALGQFGTLQGQSFAKNLVGGAKIQAAAGAGRIYTALAGLGRAGLIGLVAAAGLAIGVALALGVRQSITDAKDMGFNSAGELWVNSTAVALAKMAAGYRTWREDVQTNIQLVNDFFRQMFENLKNADFESIGKQLNEAIFDPMKASIIDLVKGFETLKLSLVDPDFLKKNAVTNLRRTLQKEFAGGGLTEIRALLEVGIPAGLGQIRGNEAISKSLEQSGDVLNSAEVQAVLDEFVFNVPPLTQEFQNALETQLMANDLTLATALTYGELKDIMDQSVDLVSDINDITEEQILTNENFKQGVLDAIAKNKLNVKGVTDNTKNLNLETDIIGEETDALIENTQGLDIGTVALDEETLQLVNNQNRLIDFTIQVDKAGIAFALLAREGSEAARRLSTLKVSKSGKFSISGRRTAGVTDAQVENLGSDVNILQEQLQDDLQNLTKIDKLLLSEAEKAAEIFDSAEIQNDDPGFSTIEDLINVGSTDTIAGLTQLIQDALASGLSSEATFPLVNQLVDLLAQQAAGVNRSDDTFDADETRELLAQLVDNVGVGETTNNVTINVDGIADESTGEDVANAFLDTLTIEGKNKLRR